MKKFLVRLGIAFAILFLGLVALFFVSNMMAATRARATIERAKTGVPTDPKAISEAAAKSKILIFRDIRSWDRTQDFEEALTGLKFKFDVKPSAEMETADLSAYDLVIIPGGQWGQGYYSTFDQNSARFERYVSNGGTLVLELNGAEGKALILPGGARMVRSYAMNNQLILPEHPILLPLGGKTIHAQFVSHGYLANLPSGALILATQGISGRPRMNHPTFIEYSHGSGRVIAACQCFHDRDGSGRGPMMQTLIEYAAVKHWFVPKNAR